jgi:hypothetical protein
MYVQPICSQLAGVISSYLAAYRPIIDVLGAVTFTRADL